MPPFWLYFPSPGASWAPLGPSWDRLGTSCAHLGPSCRVSAEKPSKNHRFYLQKSSPEPLKIKPSLQRGHDFRDFEIFENNLPFGMILVPTWLHFGSIFRVLGRLGRLLGPLGSVLGASWGRLGASWGVLARPGASWKRLGAILALKKNPPTLRQTKSGTFPSPNPSLIYS